MRYDNATIQEIRRCSLRGKSPSDELLTMWGYLNHTVLELFTLLSRMHHYQAMNKIKDFVDRKYHVLIVDGEQNPEVLMQQLAISRKTNDVTSEKILNVDVVSREDNESVGKPNKSPLVIVIIMINVRALKHF